MSKYCYEVLISYGYWEKLYLRFDEMSEADFFIKTVLSNLVEPEKVNITISLEPVEDEEETKSDDDKKEGESDE